MKLKMILGLLIITCLSILPDSSKATPIVDRTSTRDTLSIPFFILDSLGNPVDDATGDSIFIVVISPGGVEVHSDSMIFTDSRIKQFVWEDYGDSYAYMDRVSDLDGSSTSDGVFAYMLTIHDQSLGLQTVYSGQFYIANSTLDGLLDSAAFAQKAVDSLTDVLDSLESISTELAKVYDTIKLYDDNNRFQKQINTMMEVVGTKLVVGTGTATTTTIIAAGLTEVDDYWNENVITFINGNAAGQSARIIDFIAATDQIVWQPPTAPAPLFTDSFLIWGFSGISTISSGRYIGLSPTGGASINWGDVINPTATVGLTNTTVGTVTNVSNDVGLGTDAIGANELAQTAVLEIFSFDTANIFGGIGQMLKDTSAYQGAASSLTNASIATAVKDSASNNPGIFYGPSSSGTGTDTISFYAIDTTGVDTVLSDVKITVKNSSGTTIAINTTDQTGKVTLYLDAATYTIIGKQSPASPTMHLFDSHNLIVSGNSSDSILGYDLEIGSSAVPGLCRVYGYLINIDGTADKDASIQAILPNGVVRTSGLIISPNAVTSSTDSLGYFFLDLIPSDSLIPQTTKYELSISRDDGSILRKRITVPDSTSWKVTW